MKKEFKFIYIFCAVFLSVFIFGCGQIYKAGNLVDLSYPIETSIKSEIIQRYLDTILVKNNHIVPPKWRHYDKLVNLDSNNNKRVYFKSNPEEMYILSFGGMFVLSDVFNPQIKQGDWVSERSLMTNEEVIRVKKRIKLEILDVVDSLAKDAQLQDSLIYKRKL